MTQPATPGAPEQLLKEGDSLFNAGKYALAREAYLRAAEASLPEACQSIVTQAYAMAARTHLIAGEKEQGRPWLAKAAQTASLADPGGWSRYLGVRGRFEWKDNDLPRATATFEEMYAFCAENKLHERAIDAAHMVAITAPPERQVEWALKGIKAAEDGNVKSWLGPLWNNLGSTYEDMGQFDKSLDAYLKARDFHYLNGNDRNKLIADWAVGHAHRLAGHVDEAEKWLMPLPARCQTLKNGEFLGWSHHELGQIELAHGHDKEALAHLAIAQEKLREAKMPEWDSAKYEKLVTQIKDLENRLH